MNSLILENITFELQIKRKLISSIRLRHISKNILSVSAPPLVPLSLIHKFIKDNQSWVLRQSAKLNQKIELINTKSVSILGLKYSLEISLKSRDSLVIFDDQQTIHLHTASLSNSKVTKIFESRLKLYSLKLIKNELRRLQLIYHFPLNKVAVRNQSSRFGSCSSGGNLNFNWQIIFFPLDKFRHILLHEIAHLTHHNHSGNFWKLLSSYDPEWRLNRLWVKKEGSKHFLIVP